MTVESQAVSDKQNYSRKANTKTPALVIYLLDVSGSMGEMLGGTRRIDVVTTALSAMLERQVRLATKGTLIAPRFHIAIIAYSNEAYDLLGGAVPLGDLAKRGVPQLDPLQLTNTKDAFLKAEELLKKELPKYSNCPAPLVCHITDGEYTSDDPEPVARRIMAMQNDDGNVLVENIFISDSLLATPINDVKSWEGITSKTDFLPGDEGKYARKLRDMSSLLPSTYRVVMREWGYKLAADARLMLPGTSKELVELGFTMSEATGSAPGGQPN